MHNREVCSLRNYFLARSDESIYTDVIICDKGLTPLSLANEQWQDPGVLSVSDRETVWKEKKLHGRFYKALHEPFVDTVASLNWLRFGDLFGETEGFVRARLYWDRSIITDRTIVANKPDIVLMDRAQSRVFLVDITIPYDENLVKAETDKKTKYLDLAHEVTDMWDGVPTEIIPIVVSANGLISASLSGHLRRLGLRDGTLQALWIPSFMDPMPLDGRSGRGMWESR